MPIFFFFFFRGFFFNSFYLFFSFLINYLFIYLWLCWVFVSVPGLSLVVASGGHSSSRYAGLSLSRPLLLRSTGSRRAGSVVVAHGLSCSTACGIFPDQGSNPCPLHWQADSQPLRHQGNPSAHLLCVFTQVLSTVGKIPITKQPRTTTNSWSLASAGPLPALWRFYVSQISSQSHFFLFFFCLAVQCDMRALSSPTRDRTRARCSGSMES